MKVGDRVARRQPIIVNSCGCRGCWLGHNQGEVLGLTDAGVIARFGFGTVETFRDEEQLRVLDPIEALAEIDHERR